MPILRRLEAFRERQIAFGQKARARALKRTREKLSIAQERAKLEKERLAIRKARQQARPKYTSDIFGKGTGIFAPTTRTVRRRKKRRKATPGRRTVRRIETFY